MTDARKAKLWTVLGVAALAATGALAVKRQIDRRTDVDVSAILAGEDLRDAVAEPTVATTHFGLGRSVPAYWFKAPGARHAQLDAVLLSSRRRRARAQAVSLQ